MRETPFWKSRKFIILVVGILAVVAVVLGGTAIGMDDESRDKALDIIKWLAMAALGTHAASDVGAMFAFRGDRDREASQPASGDPSESQSE